MIASLPIQETETDLHICSHIERIAMILSAMRMTFSIASELNTDKPSSVSPEFYSGQLVCSDTDYATAELIGNKLILHMAQAYQMIKGTQKIAQPTVKPLDQKQILLSLLPEEFESKTLVSEAQSQGISRATAIRWNDEWQLSGCIQKIRHGVYKKIA